MLAEVRLSKSSLPSAKRLHSHATRPAKHGALSTAKARRLLNLQLPHVLQSRWSSRHPQCGLLKGLADVCGEKPLSAYASPRCHVAV